MPSDPPWKYHPPGWGRGRWAGRTREARELSQAQVAELYSIRLDLAASFSQQSQPGEAARGCFSPLSALYFHRQEGVNSCVCVPPLPLTPQDRFHTVSRSAKKGEEMENSGMINSTCFSHE